VARRLVFAGKDELDVGFGANSTDRAGSVLN
jgi:hypothetical protein